MTLMSAKKAYCRKPIAMARNRRNFLRQTASFTAITTVAGFEISLHQRGLTSMPSMATKDAVIQLGESYFRGLEERRISFARQLDVLGAVSGLRALVDSTPWNQNLFSHIKKFGKMPDFSGTRSKVLRVLAKKRN